MQTHNVSNNVINICEAYSICYYWHVYLYTVVYIHTDSFQNVSVRNKNLIYNVKIRGNVQTNWVLLRFFSKIIISLKINHLYFNLDTKHIWNAEKIIYLMLKRMEKRMKKMEF